MQTTKRTMYPSQLLLALATACTLFSSQSRSALAADPYPNSADGAKAVISEFLKPGADLKGLTQKLRPSEADYAAVFEASLAPKARAMYDPVWSSGALVVAPKEGQTELMIHGIPTSEIRQWSPKASAFLPGGYKEIATDVKDGNTIYAFKFVKPGEQSGMAFDGLVFVNGHWCLMPKPWRAAAAPAK